MTVAELIKYLESQPQDIVVAYSIFSEQCLMEVDDINLVDGCEARGDGWIQNKRPDKHSRQYLLFPGN